VEGLLWIAAFCAWQCLVRVPEGAVLVVRAGRRRRIVRGPALRLLPPWPLASGVVVAALPFEVTATEVLASTPLRRLGRLERRGETRAAALDAGEPFEANGVLLRHGGSVLVRALSPEHATRLADLLSRLVAADPRERLAATRVALQRSLSPEALVETLEATQRALRPSAWFCTGLLGVVFALLALRQVGAPDAAWIGLAALAGALDLAALTCLWRAHTRLCPERAAERWTHLLGFALFPPALLRAGDTLARGSLCLFHPAAFAALCAERAALLEVVRRELACLRHPAWRGVASETSERAAPRGRFLAESEVALLDLARREGVTQEEIEAAPSPLDSDATSYCPLCFAQFRPGYARCNDCALATLPCLPSLSEGSQALP
jgi:hypothetical protein